MRYIIMRVIILIGKRLREARVNRKLTQQKVADTIGVVPSTIAAFEQGRALPRMKTLEKLCTLYDISPLTLLEKTYLYSDISEISFKPVTQRTYEETVALTFFRFANYTEEFLAQTRALDRFGKMRECDVDTLRKDYNTRETEDIEFAYHILKDTVKTTFLSMLMGLLTQRENLQDLDNIETAQAVTIRRLGEQIEKIRE